MKLTLLILFGLFAGQYAFADAQAEKIEDYPEEFKHCLRDLLNKGVHSVKDVSSNSSSLYAGDDKLLDKGSLVSYSGCREAVEKFYPDGDFSPLFATMKESVSEVEQCRSCAEKKGLIDSEALNFKACLEKDGKQKCDCLKVYNINSDNPEVRKYANYVRMKKVLLSMIDQEKTYVTVKRIFPSKNFKRCEYPKQCQKFKMLQSNFSQISDEEKLPDIKRLNSELEHYGKSKENATYQDLKKAIRSYSETILQKSPNTLAKDLVTRLSHHFKVLPVSQEATECSNDLIGTEEGENNCKKLKVYLGILPEKLDNHCKNIQEQIARLCTESKEEDVDLERVVDQLEGDMSDILKAEFAQYSCNYQSGKHHHDKDEGVIFDDPIRKGPIREIVSGLSGFSAGKNEESSDPLANVVEGPETDASIMDSFSKAFKSMGETTREQNQRRSNQASVPKVSYQRDITYPTEKIEELNDKQLEERSDLVDKRIKELEQQLADKEKVASTQEGEKKKKSSDGISDEIKKLLEELKVARSENKALRSEIERRKSDPGVESQVTKNNIPTNYSAFSEPAAPKGNSRVEKQTYESGKNSLVRSGPVTTAQQNGGGDNHRVAESTPNAKNTPLLSFSYQDFVKMDKETFYKENKGKIVEVIKYDEKGNPVTYILKPIFNEQGEFVDYNLVEKSELEKSKDKKDKKDEEEKKEESKEESIGDKIRAFYKTLKGYFTKP